MTTPSRGRTAELEHRPFAVIGATGQQGGAVVDALLAAGRPVRALVRDPTSAGSRGLAASDVALATRALDPSVFDLATWLKDIR